MIKCARLCTGASMSARSGTALTLALLLGAFMTSAAAQSTTVSIVNEDGSAAPPAGPLIADTDYPLESLFAAEEGTVAVGVQIGPDGKVSAMQLIKSSGAARLDQQAGALIRTRLAFPPAQAHTAKVEVNWKLPLTRADEVSSKMLGFSAAGKSIALPVRETRMLSTDYSLLSIK